MNKDFERESKQIEYVQKTKCEKTIKDLIEQYRPLIESTVAKALNVYRAVPLDENDIRQIAEAQVWENIMTYDFNSKKSFASFNKQFLDFKIKNIFREFATNKHKSMNFSSEYIEEISSDSYINVYKYIENKENRELLYLIKTLNENDLDKNTLLLRDLIFQGFSIPEAAKIIGCSKQGAYILKEKLVSKIHNKFSL